VNTLLKLNSPRRNRCASRKIPAEPPILTGWCHAATQVVVELKVVEPVAVGPKRPRAVHITVWCEPRDAMVLAIVEGVSRAP
jgi:hypothetical protein